MEKDSNSLNDSPSTSITHHPMNSDLAFHSLPTDTILHMSQEQEQMLPPHAISSSAEEDESLLMEGVEDDKDNLIHGEQDMDLAGNSQIAADVKSEPSSIPEQESIEDPHCGHDEAVEKEEMDLARSEDYSETLGGEGCIYQESTAPSLSLEQDANRVEIDAGEPSHHVPEDIPVPDNIIIPSCSSMNEQHEQDEPNSSAVRTESMCNDFVENICDASSPVEGSSGDRPSIQTDEFHQENTGGPSTMIHRSESPESDSSQEESAELGGDTRVFNNRNDSTSTYASTDTHVSFNNYLPSSLVNQRSLAHLANSRVWESDKQAQECRRCNRRFNFIVRRHHCRRCGQIVCDRCSTHRIQLPEEEVIKDPLVSMSEHRNSAKSPQRVCDTCVRVPFKVTKQNASQNGSRAQAMGMRRTDSQQSVLTECPVCGFHLLRMQKDKQERHLQQCLNTGSPPVRPTPRYIVYRLSDRSPQLNEECPICFEEFTIDNMVARMECLCSYHDECLSDWLKRGKGCPVHYDTSFA